MTGHRLNDLRRFHLAMDRLGVAIGGARQLSQCDGRMAWPKRGVYFFLESGEERRESGTGPRVVRVGTHALKAGSKSTLWGRLSQHRGTKAQPGGNHRGSVFRLHAGAALATRHPEWRCESWGKGQTAKGAVRESERPLERAVSEEIGRMRILWLAVDDLPGPASDRGYVERHAIALLSNLEKTPLDAPSEGWLGHKSASPQVQRSGLWNVNHVSEHYDPAFLDKLDALIEAAG